MQANPAGSDRERRYATVVFADVSGSMALLQSADAEGGVRVIEACLAIIERAIRAHGGHVHQHLGDCVVGLFGAPHAVEEGAKCAVNAAIDLELARRVGEGGGGHRAARRVDVANHLERAHGMFGGLALDASL